MTESDIRPDKEEQPKSPKILLFDLGGVVLAYSDEHTHSYLSNLGVNSEDARKFFLCDEYGQFGRGVIDEKGFSEALRKHMKLPDLTDDQLREAHHAHIYGLVPGMVELIDDLSKNYRIAFVTDTNTWQMDRQSQLIDLQNYQIFTSHKLGMMKADPEMDHADGKRTFFSVVLSELEIKPEEGLLIDDSPEKIAAASSLGIPGILFEGVKDLKQKLNRMGISNI